MASSQDTEKDLWGGSKKEPAWPFPHNRLCCAHDCPGGERLQGVCLLSYLLLAHRRFLQTQCRALLGAGTATQEQPDLKPLLHSQLCLHTRYLSLLEPCPSQSPDSQDKGLLTRSTKNLLRKPSTGQTITWGRQHSSMALGLSRVLMASRLWPDKPSLTQGDSIFLKT